MNAEVHIIKKDSSSAGHPVGTQCYVFNGHDYGCAREDTFYSGVSHISMTLDPDGRNPYFTIPVEDLEPMPVPTYVFAGGALRGSAAGGDAA